MSDRKRVIDLGSFGTVVIDPSKLEFNEVTLSKYMEREGGWYDYFGQKLADAEYVLSQAEHAYDTAFAAVFKSVKEQGGSDKLAEAESKADPGVMDLKANVMSAKHSVKLLQQHLRSWDRNHDNAQSRGHTLRKEMDKLNPTIYGGAGHSDQAVWNRRGEEVDEIVKPANEQSLDELK